MGDGAGLEQWYRDHWADARRLAFLLTGDVDLAEDLVQEAFTKLAGRMVQLRNEEAFGPYLRRMLVNGARSSHRQRTRESSRIERSGVWDQRATATPGLDEQAAVWNAVMELPPRQRAAIVLRFYEDCSERDIAAALRCRPGTVKSLVSRGLQTMRERIEHE